MEKPALNRRERRKQKTNEQIKAATAVLLIEEGFDALTIQKITDRADLARATFYLHFGDVEEVVWTVLAESFTELTHIMWQADSDDPKTRRYLKWVKVFEFIDNHRQLMQVLSGDKGHIKLFRRFIGFIAQNLEADIKNGRVQRTTELPIPFEAQFYSGGVLQIINWWLHEEPERTPNQLAQMVFEIILREQPPI
ncbi:MAG: TetR/AcrR family transcriptional regulator [Chloroflexota bacterium]